MSDDPLDRLLVASLTSRPDARPIPDLATRAVRRARALDVLLDEQRRTLTIQRWRLRFAYSAASLLIALLIFFGGHRLLSERSVMSSSDDSISSSEASMSTNGSTTGTYVAWLGGLLFICTLAGLATESAVASNRPSLVA